MQFGPFPLSDALGIRLAHTIRLAGKTLRKGRALTTGDIEALNAAGIQHVVGALLAADEIDEDTAAAAGAACIAGLNVAAQPASKGRCNLKATEDGLLVVDASGVDVLNAMDEALTLATLRPNALVRRGDVVATVKTIPFAVAQRTLDSWRTCNAPRLRVQPFIARKVALVMTSSSATSRKLLDSTEAVTRARVEALGSDLAIVLRCEHISPAIAAAVRGALDDGVNLVLIAGASVSKDRADVVPAGVTMAGGSVVHFGMPVEPGNMLLLAHVDDTPVINLPGCARSRRLNGFDWVLHRVLARLPLTPADIMAMGVGGLLASGDEQPSEGGESDDLPRIPPEIKDAARPPRIAAIVLAAGRSARMGAENKLCCTVDGIPMVRRAVTATLASRCVQTLVVTGHDAPRVESAIGDLPVSYVHNAEYASGMASSLRAGLRALPRDVDGAVIVLGDMPHLQARHLDALIQAFDPVAPAIVVPEFEGRRGNPVLWPAAYFSRMQQLSGDQGARSLLEADASNVVRVVSADAAVCLDVDTPEQLAALSSPLSSRPQESHAHSRD